MEAFPHGVPADYTPTVLMQRTLVLIPALVLAVGAHHNIAWAQGSPESWASLTWDAPSGCPSVDELWARIDDLAADAIVGAPISVRVAASADGHTASVISGDAVREIRAGNCDVATSAVALVIAATMIAPAPPPLGETARLGDASQEVDTLVDGSLDGPLEEDALDAEVPSRRTTEGLRGTAAASVGVAFGPLPDPRPLTIVRIGIRTGGFELDVAWFHATPWLEDGRNAGGALVRLGWVLGALPFEVAFQVAGQVGTIQVGTMWEGWANSAATALWGAVGAGLEGRYWWDESVGIAIYGDMLLPVSRSTAPLLGEHRVDELPSVIVRLGAGMLVQFD